MVYSYNYLDDYLKEFEQKLKTNGYSSSDLKEAKADVKDISKSFLQWVDLDGYKESCSDTKFSLSNKPGAWKATPTDFFILIWARKASKRHKIVNLRQFYNIAKCNMLTTKDLNIS